MTYVDAAWMDAAACSSAPHSGLPWQADAHTLPRVVVDLMGMVCAGCPVLAACAGYALATGVTGGFWAGADRDPHRDQAPAAQLTLDDLLELDVPKLDVPGSDVFERAVLGGAA